jgi:hypothetical protein
LLSFRGLLPPLSVALPGKANGLAAVPTRALSRRLRLRSTLSAWQRVLGVAVSRRSSLSVPSMTKILVWPLAILTHTARDIRRVISARHYDATCGENASNWQTMDTI